MDWEFQQRSIAGDNDAAAKSRIIIEGDHTITPFEIFVREVLQNSLDAAQNGGRVRVRFKFRSIGMPGQRTNFLDALGWSRLKERVQAANRVRLARDEPPEFADPQRLEANSIEVLEISEIGTIGLVGPELVRNENDERRIPGEPPKAYIALTRDDARREKQGLGSGGTYGLGKAVLWAASQIQTVVFFSRLSIPFQGTLHRAAAQARLGPHYNGETPFRGLGYGGEMAQGWARPLRDQQAQSMATRMGINRREALSEVGTTILIPFWSEPANDDEGLATHAKIARYAARYFWPAIVDERLEVIAEDENGHEQDATDHLTHYQPFIALYQRVKAGQLGSHDVRPQRVHFTVPPGPPPRRTGATQTFAIASMAFVIGEDEVREDFNRKVACIRGQGMVVGYAKMTGNTLVRPFVGVALGGRASDSEQGTRGDVLLGFSEYVTHTRWDEKSPNLSRYWEPAKAVIRELLRKLRDYFETNSRVEQPETNADLSPLEEGLKFPGLGRGGSPTPHTPGQPQLRLRSFTRENNRYRFELRVTVEADKPPVSVELCVEPAMETGNARSEDRFALETVTTVPPNLQIEDLDNGKVRVSIPTFSTGAQVRISGVTELIPAEVFAISEGLLKASPSTERQLPEPEQIGEE